MAKTLILPGHGYWLGRRGGMVIIKRAGGEKREVSVGNIKRIVANARGLSISGDALYLLLRHDIQLILMSRSRPVGILHPVARGAPIALKKRQVTIQDTSDAYELAKAFIYGKLSNQIELLRQLRRNVFRRRRDQSEILFDGYNEIMGLRARLADLPFRASYKRDIIGIEAEASRIYWSTLSLVLPDWVGFDRRRKRFEGASDPLNLGLNYLYSILAGVVWSALELNGLDPWIGYLHKDSNRRPSLVMDVMEEFRQPVVDKPLIRYIIRLRNAEGLVRDGRITELYREELLKLFFGRLGEKVGFDGYYTSFDGHINRQVRRLAKYIIGKVRDYKPFMRL